MRSITPIAVFAILLLYGCSRSDQSDPSNALRIGNGEEPNSLDPHIATTVAEAHILFSLFEGLISHDPYNPQAIVPGVAEEWHFDPNENRYLFRLRPSAKWSDGTPISADHFALSAERALTPEFGTAYPEMFFDIENAQSYFQGDLADFAQVGIKAISERELEITLDKPTPHFLQKLKHFAWLPVPVHFIASFGDWKNRSTQWTGKGEMVSNGPFALKSWVRNSLIEVHRSKNYWDTKNVTLQTIQFFPYENAQIEHHAFLSKQLHLTDKIPTDFIGESTNRPPYQKSDSFLATSYLIFNIESSKFANVDLRKALSLSIDKESLAHNINRSGQAAHSFTPNTISGYSPPITEPHDPKIAQALLKQAFPPSTKIPELRFLVSNNPSSRAVAEAIQAMWNETLGIDVTLLNMEAKTLFSSLDSGDFEISYLSWAGDYEDPSAFLDIWSSRNSKNRARWKDLQYDDFLEKAALENDSTSRMALLSQAESILLEQSPIVPLIWKTKDYCIHESVTNWPPALLDMRSYKKVGLKPNR